MSIEQQRLQPVGVWLDLSTDKPAVRPNETFTLSVLFFYRMEGGMPTPIPNAKINFYRDYILRGFLYTDANGRAELLVLAEPTPGTYVYWVECDEVTPPVTSDKLTIVVTLEPLPTTLTLNADYELVYRGDMVTFTGRLSSNAVGVPMSAVRLYANGRDMKVETETDGQGRFVLPWVTWESGEYNCTVRFAGAELLQSSESNALLIKVAGIFERTHFVGHADYTPQPDRLALIDECHKIEQQIYEEQKVKIRFVDIKIKHIFESGVAVRTDIDFIFDIPYTGEAEVAGTQRLIAWALVVLILIVLAIISAAVIVYIAFKWWSTWVEKAKIYVCEQCVPPLTIQGWLAYVGHLKTAHPVKHEGLVEEEKRGEKPWWEEMGMTALKWALLGSGILVFIMFLPQIAGSVKETAAVLRKK